MPLPTPALPGSTPPGPDATVVKRLSPGAPGTRRWQERFGATLVCVRYRQDAAQGRRYTTVEIVVDERNYQPPTALVRIAYTDTALRHEICKLGGQWLAERKLWRVPRSAVKALRLENCVVEDGQ